MTIESLTIIGASPKPERWSHRALRKALEDDVDVYAVNPTVQEIQVNVRGVDLRIRTYASVRDVPRVTDCFILYRKRSEITGETFRELSELGYERGDIPPGETIDVESSDRLRRLGDENGFEGGKLAIDICYVRDGL